MIEIFGRGGIVARIIADSMNGANGSRIITYELEYQRFIHSEFMTHRQLSKNSASSRAIPVKTMHEHIRNSPQAPVEWGKNMPGMQAKEFLTPEEWEHAVSIWDESRESAIHFSKELADLGVHKQIANRVTEPFMQMKVVVTGTEWANFFWLRNHPDAQPEIRELAQCMWKAYASHAPNILSAGEWHLPYINTTFDEQKDTWIYTDEAGRVLYLGDAKVISASCCAQVSYRKLDDNFEKAKMIYDKLINSEPVHASPVEHQATPMAITASFNPHLWEPGVTHADRKGDLWSGNFKGWIQHRQLIPNHSR